MKNALSTYLDEISNYTILDGDKQNELAFRAKKGDLVAQKQLVETNLKFVVSIARQYIGQGLPLEDLISEGNIGIIKAIERFDPKQNTKFLTYASWWIRQCILSLLTEQNRQVRLPANKVGLIQQYNRTAVALEQLLNREVSEGEVLTELGVSSEDIVRQSSVSYNIDFEEGTTLLDLIPDKETPPPDAQLMKDSLTEEMSRVLNRLSERERTILKMYYGFGYPRPYTLEEIGESLNLTRERIRQLRNKAIRELRRLDRRKKLEHLKN